MLLSILTSGENIQTILLSLLLTLPGMMLALSVHETAHGYAAWKCGDPTAYNLGRLTLNPLKHLDPLGFFALLIFGYGWAKPVPINTRYFRNPKRGMVISALAGPLSNLIMGILFAVLTGVSACFAYYFSIPDQMGMSAELLGIPSVPDFVKNALNLLSSALLYTSQINFLYMAFNMIPVPPFDGSRIMLAFLPTKTYFKIMQYERQILFGVLIAMMLLSRFGLSPFGWIAETLSDLIYLPIANGILSALLG